MWRPPYRGKKPTLGPCVRPAARHVEFSDRASTRNMGTAAGQERGSAEAGPSKASATFAAGHDDVHTLLNYLGRYSMYLFKPYVG